MKTKECEDFEIIYDAQIAVINTLTAERNAAQAQAAKFRLVRADVIRLTAERDDEISLLNSTLESRDRNIETLQSERDVLKQDAKRLEWLEAHKRPAEIYVDGVPHRCNHYGIAAAANITLRAAIDAAMEKTK